jgi:beta-galactosidase
MRKNKVKSNLIQVLSMTGFVLALLTGCQPVSPQLPVASTTSFQTFETTGGTINAYGWSGASSTAARSATQAHAGSYSVEYIHGGAGGANANVVITPESGAASINLTANGETKLVFWVYDTQGSNTVNVKIIDSLANQANVWTTASSTQNSWTEFTMNLSDFTGVNMAQVASIEFIEWNPGTYYIDDVGSGM